MTDGTLFLIGLALLPMIVAGTAFVRLWWRKRSPVSRDFSAPGMPYAGIIEHDPRSADLPFTREGRRR